MLKNKRPTIDPCGMPPITSHESLLFAFPSTELIPEDIHTSCIKMLYC